jgi:hypothetical protein
MSALQAMVKDVWLSRAGHQFVNKKEFFLKGHTGGRGKRPFFWSPHVFLVLVTGSKTKYFCK